METERKSTKPIRWPEILGAVVSIVGLLFIFYSVFAKEGVLHSGRDDDGLGNSVAMLLLSQMIFLLGGSLFQMGARAHLTAAFVAAIPAFVATFAEVVWIRFVLMLPTLLLLGIYAARKNRGEAKATSIEAGAFIALGVFFVLFGTLGVLWFIAMAFKGW